MVYWFIRSSITRNMFEHQEHVRTPRTCSLILEHPERVLNFWITPSDSSSSHFGGCSRTKEHTLGIRTIKGNVLGSMLWAFE